jgi:alpha-glucan phosphorylase-like protein
MDPEMEGVRAYQRRDPDYIQFYNFLSRLNEQSTPEEIAEHGDLTLLADIITKDRPFISWSMEFYDQEECGIKGGGGLGVLEADIRRVCQKLGLPMIIATPHYTSEVHQKLDDNFWQVEFNRYPNPYDKFQYLGSTAVGTVWHDNVELDILGLELGSTRLHVVTRNPVLSEDEEDKDNTVTRFGELYPGGNSDNHRLFQQVALGFGVYKDLKARGIEAPFMQLNEAPTVFAAIARLNDLCSEGADLQDALSEVREQFIFTNHTLVPAVEGQFTREQFADFVLTNIDEGNEELTDWIQGMFTKGDWDPKYDTLKLSELAIELADKKTGVSKLHARVAEFFYKIGEHAGQRVNFDAVTNGISDKWVTPELLHYFEDLGIIDEFGLPGEDYKHRLLELDTESMRSIKRLGRAQLIDVINSRLRNGQVKPRRSEEETTHGIEIEDDAVIINFNKRIADYKRPDLVFDDSERLADILESKNAYLVISGKTHGNDKVMKEALQKMLLTANGNDVLRKRVIYIEDYDEEVGRAISIGSDVAINVPIVGKEACGTSWEKDLINGKRLNATVDGGIADVEAPIVYLDVKGDDRHQEADSLLNNLEESIESTRDDDRYIANIINQLYEYLPTILGARMMGDYLKMFASLMIQRAQIEAVLEGETAETVLV